MAWLKDVNDDIYDPSYTDMLRVAFTSRFNRGKAYDLVALLGSPRDEAVRGRDRGRIVRQAQGRNPGLQEPDPLRAVHDDPPLGRIRCQFAHQQPERGQFRVRYPLQRRRRQVAAELERTVRRWFVMSVPTDGIPAARKPSSTRTCARWTPGRHGASRRGHRHLQLRDCSSCPCSHGKGTKKISEDRASGSIIDAGHRYFTPFEMREPNHQTQYLLHASGFPSLIVQLM